MQSQMNTLGLKSMSHDSFGFLRIPLFHQFWNPTQFRDPLSFGILDEPPCYVGAVRVYEH